MDAELAAGHYRGPLHGIPYGLKDLFDTAGIKTTWGAEPWRDRVPQGDATVVRRLREAGAAAYVNKMDAGRQLPQLILSMAHGQPQVSTQPCRPET